MLGRGVSQRAAPHSQHFSISADRWGMQSLAIHRVQLIAPLSRVVARAARPVSLRIPECTVINVAIRRQLRVRGISSLKDAAVIRASRATAHERGRGRSVHPPGIHPR